MLRSIADLIANKLASIVDLPWLEKINKKFPVLISNTIAQKIKVSNSNGLNNQFVPKKEELEVQAYELTDPISDNKYTPTKGLVHRYPDRVLLKIINICPIYCRFCFRKEFLGKKDEALTADDLEKCYTYLRNHKEIWEVILTGGDPLMLNAQKLAKIITTLNSIPHIEIIRIHTRIPIVDPKRIDTNMLQVLTNSKNPVFILLHINHPDEFTDLAIATINKLHKAQIPLLSQTVLLKGINDDLDTLSKLMRLLVKFKIIPHYLHHPDLVTSTKHFRVSIEDGQKLIAQLHGKFSGLCQPKYVLDIPGGAGKSPIAPQYIEKIKDNLYRIKDYNGMWHEYIDHA